MRTGIYKKTMNVGVSALAREVGLTASAIGQKLNKGMTPDQIRTEAEMRKVMGAMGLGGRTGRPKGSASADADADVSLASSYVPPNQRRPGAGAAQLPPAIPPPPRVPPPLVPRASPSALPDKVIAEVGPETYTDRENFYHARERKEIALANEKEFRVAQLRGELAPVVQVNAWVSGCIVKARDVFLRIGPELRDRLAAESDPVACERMVVAEVERGLEALRTFPAGQGQQAEQAENEPVDKDGNGEAA